MNLIIPDDLPWPVLDRYPNGDIDIDRNVIDYIARSNGLDPAVLDESAVCDLLVKWYSVRRQSGYPPDHVMEEIITEMLDEDEADGKTR